MNRDDRMQQYLDRLQRLILEHGWAVQGVFPTESCPPGTTWFAYTVGLHKTGLPELLIAGNFGPENLQAILNETAKDHLDLELSPGDITPQRLHVIAAPAAEIGVANRLYGPRVRVVQLVWPDDDGRYPGEAGYDDKKYPQQLFGPATYLEGRR